MIRLINTCLLLMLTSCFNAGNGDTDLNIVSNRSSLSEKNEYYCEYCGKKFDNIRDMAINSCKKHPYGILAGSHKLYEGKVKEWYECKYCGKRAKSIVDLVSNKCKYAPDKGWHRPRY